MFSNIVVATDGSEHADKAVAVAADLASKYEANITLLHVQLRRNPETQDVRRLIDIHSLAPDIEDAFLNYEKAENLQSVGGQSIHVSLPIPTEILAAVGEAILNKSKKILEEHGARNISSTIVEGDAAKAILRCAEQQNADLIVMGTRGLSDLQGLFIGSVSHKVSHLAKCTCITVR